MIWRVILFWLLGGSLAWADLPGPSAFVPFVGFCSNNFNLLQKETKITKADGAGNLTYLTNRNTHVWTFQYDGANRVTNTISPTGRTTADTYTNWGLLATVRDALTNTTTFTYDAKRRLTQRADNAGTLGYQYDNDDLLVVTNAGTGAALTWGYDWYDRPSVCTNAAGYVIKYGYDGNGNLTNLTYPGNLSVGYIYDPLNRATNVADWGLRQTAQAYDQLGGLARVTRPNGTERGIGSDDDEEPEVIVEQYTAGAMAIDYLEYSWSNTGRLAWEFDAPLPHAYTPPSRTMTYDADNRLTNLNGNSVTVDADGNMTYGPGTNNTFLTYTYNARNQLTGAGGLTYGYDPAGNRTLMTNGSVITTNVIDPVTSQLLMRIKAGTTNYYIYGAGLLYEIDVTATTTNTLFYHYDSRGSTIAITDGSGNITDRMEYGVFGMMTYHSGGTDTPFLYNGEYGVQTDPNGLLYMRARYYNPYICRFINADPSGFAGGLNMYAFADGNPVTEMDPFGLDAAGANNGFTWFGSINDAPGGNPVIDGPWSYFQGSGVVSDVGATALNLASTVFNGISQGLDAVGNAVAGGAVVVGMASDGMNSAATTVLGPGGFEGLGPEGVALDDVAAGLSEIGALARTGGTRIALGSRFSGLRTFASNIGADHLVNVPNNQWKNLFLSHVRNPSTTFHVNMAGFIGKTPTEMIMNEMQSGSNTGWELQQLQNAGRLPQVNFYQPGQSIPIPNPFSR